MAPSRTDRDDDPLWLATRPPPNETPEQAALRKKREADAKAISNRIDELIHAESIQLKKKKIVRLLLLGGSKLFPWFAGRLTGTLLPRSGQSESGKSTTLKQFQILHSPNAFQNERLSWRLVIQLNLVKSIRRILEAVIHANLASPDSPKAIAASDDRWDTSASGIAYPRMSMESLDSTLSTSTRATDDFTDYKLRLMPLLRVEEILTQKLASPDSHGYNGDALGGREGYNHLSWTTAQTSAKEMFVRSGDMWKLAVSSGEAEPQADEATYLIFQVREYMISLWANQTVREVLEREKINLTESSGL